MPVIKYCIWDVGNVIYNYTLEPVHYWCERRTADRETFLRNLPLTAAGQVDMIITEMGVMNITPQGIELVEINPEFTVEEVQAATEPKLIVSPDLKPMC